MGDDRAFAPSFCCVVADIEAVSTTIATVSDDGSASIVAVLDVATGSWEPKVGSAEPGVGRE